MASIWGKNDILPSIITPKSLELNRWHIMASEYRIAITTFRLNLLLGHHSPKRSRSFWNSWRSQMLLWSSTHSYFQTGTIEEYWSLAELRNDIESIITNSPPISHVLSELSDRTPPITKANLQIKLTSLISTEFDGRLVFIIINRIYLSKFFRDLLYTIDFKLL
jgi:hypothetical protein